MVKCTGSTNPKKANVPIVLANKTNTGIDIKTQNIPLIKNSFKDIKNCTYVPIQIAKPNLPNKDNFTDIASWYKSNKFIANNVTVNNSCNIIPRGLIIAFYDTKIPEGWALCNGDNCTPDLRGRSILGGESIKYKIGDYGGEEKHLLTIGELPSHKHKYAMSQKELTVITDVDAIGGREWVNTKSNNQVTQNTYLNNKTNLPHNNMPPFKVCTYIMKL